MTRFRLISVALILACPPLLFAATTSPSTAPAANVVLQADSLSVRQNLMTTLHGLPPEVGMVLKLDPTLFGNHDYLGSYPSLAAFVNDHPEVVHNPRFFLENVDIHTDYRPDPPNVRIWDRMMETLSILFLFILAAGTILWVVKTLAENRRSNRVTQAQNETMSKLLDRFGSNDELIAYLESPGGKRLLDAAGGSAEPGQRALSAPMNRIFWSVQVGLVATAVGVGMQFVSFHVPPEVYPPVFALGVVLLSIGVGFMLSAFVSYVLSRRLGLWPPQAAAH
jgi:hypothetical protein